MAQHMITKHPGLKPHLEFEILFLERNTLLRKIKEGGGILYSYIRTYTEREE